MSTTSPLHAQHEALGATMTDFAGYTMPVRYTSDIAEHEAVRTTAGLFDVSHMGEIYVTGAQAAAALEYALVGRMSAVGVGRAKYTMLCAPDGGVLDDLIVYRTASDAFLVVANAGNSTFVAAELAVRCGNFECVVEDVSAATSLIAVQGPAARGIVMAMTSGFGDDAVGDLKYYASTTAKVDGVVQALVGRTGYTGEDGFELFVAAADAEHMWDSALRNGTAAGMVACGLASRDTLRLEAGMPLHGAEIGADRSPYAAGLGWAVQLGTTKVPRGEFVGKKALAAAAESDAGWWAKPAEAPLDARVLIGMRGEGRRAARAGYSVLDADGAEVGDVTSGAPSPSLGNPIAMAYVHPRVAADGTDLAVDVRGRLESMKAWPLPFYKRAQ